MVTTHFMLHVASYCCSFFLHSYASTTKSFLSECMNTQRLFTTLFDTYMASVTSAALIDDSNILGCAVQFLSTSVCNSRRGVLGLGRVECAPNLAY